MADPRNAAAIVDEALAIAKKVAPGADAFVRVASGREANTRFARSEITSTGEVEETRVEVRIAFGRRHATTETNQIEPAALRSAVETAARLAKMSPPDPELEPLLGPQKHASVAAFDRGADALDPAARADGVAASIEAAEKAQVELAGFFAHRTARTVVGNSAGLRGTHDSTLVSCTATARTKDGTGSGWGGARSHRAVDVGAGGIARVAIEKAARSQKPRPLDPGRYTVVLEAEAVANLLSFVTPHLDARLADEGRSPFAKAGGTTRVGEKVFADVVTLRSDPSDPQAPTAPFDEDGMPLRPAAWAEKGTLQKLWVSRHWAQKKGTAPTGRPRGLQLDAGTSSTQELIAGTKRGLLVTRFWYIRMVDPQQLLVTGLTRDGLFLIEDGKVVAPVKNFRFNESPVAMLRNTDALTKARVVAGNQGGLLVPALRAHEFRFSSTSDAV